MGIRSCKHTANSRLPATHAFKSSCITANQIVDSCTQLLEAFLNFTWWLPVSHTVAVHTAKTKLTKLWRMVWQSEALGCSYSTIAQNLNVDKSTVCRALLQHSHKCDYPKDSAARKFQTLPGCLFASCHKTAGHLSLWNTERAVGHPGYWRLTASPRNIAISITLGVLNTGCHGYCVNYQRLPWQLSCNTPSVLNLKCTVTLLFLTVHANTVMRYHKAGRRSITLHLLWS